MYSGTTLGKNSGNVIGAHQRIDRIARRMVQPHLNDHWFPTEKQILYFEGNNGPDGIKRKSPSVDEPWHYLDPDEVSDESLIEMITDHQENLSAALKNKNPERAAFEAAWMAHAIVDGLTPAHHVPLAKHIETLFGMVHTERQTVKQKSIIKGTNRRDTLSKNWQYWGKRGIFMNHVMFEFGVSTTMLSKRYNNIHISADKLAALKKHGYKKVFHGILQEVITLGTYESYVKNGWTATLATSVRRQLVPLLAEAVALGWYASLPKKSRK